MNRKVLLLRFVVKNNRNIKLLVGGGFSFCLDLVLHATAASERQGR